MSNFESEIQQRIRLAVGSLPHARIFRNSVGQGWVGRALRPSGTMNVTVGKGDVVLYEARPMTAGLCTGSPDLIGWRTVTISPKHVGRRLALFVGIEVKTPTGRTSEQQANFLAVLQQHGALSGVARNTLEALRIVDGGADGL